MNEPPTAMRLLKVNFSLRRASGPMVHCSMFITVRIKSTHLATIQQNLRQSCNLNVLSTSTYCCQITHDVFSRHSLAGSTFSTDNDALSLFVNHHVAKHVVCQSVNVWGILITRLKQVSDICILYAAVANS